jgi:hypothetical protein
MTPEEEFEKWYEEKSARDLGLPIIKDDFLECFLLGKTIGYGQGWQQGYSDGEIEGYNQRCDDEEKYHK